MSNALVPLNEVEKMAAAVAKSGLFGVKTADQALALMLVAQAEGRHPALAARDYDIIQGKPAKKAEAMLRDFLESGGKVEWHKLDDTAADATFAHPSGGTVRIEWTMKRAVSAGLGGKDMWKKYPRQMLRSRTVSEGIRTVCPMATSGMYVPEEVHDIVREKNITPTSGAADRVNPERQNEIKAVVDKMTEWLNQDMVGDAICEQDNAALDADETVYLWTFFDSKQRRKMTEERARVKAGIIEGEVVKPITDEEALALEARLTENEIALPKVKKTFGVKSLSELTTTQLVEAHAMIDTTIAQRKEQQAA